MHIDTQSVTSAHVHMLTYRAVVAAYLRAAEAHSGKKISALAKEAGVAHTTFTRFLSDDGYKYVPKIDKLLKIAEQSGLPLPTDLLAAEDTHVRERRTVPVVGYVGAGAAAHFYGTGDGELDRVEAPDYANENTVAAEIRGESMGPLLEHWLVFWDEVRTRVTPDLLGHICVVGLPDDRILVKQLKAASAPGLFHLISNNEAPMLDQEIMWAAKVKGMQPR